MNKVILIGNICHNMEIRYTANNIAVLQNSIAVRNDFKNANGEYESEFINIVVWRQTAEFLSKYASKGSKVLVEGRLTNRSYEKQDGTKGYVTEVVAEKVELLGNRKEEPEKEVKESSSDPAKTKDDPFAEFGQEIEQGNADDLPF